ncbi:MAG TPA: tail fiber protein [Conexibacter sp.]|nr:tail fiber protein [Conexibacter sp.]
MGVPLDDVDADVEALATDLGARVAAVLAAAVMPGEIRMWSLPTAPSSWAICNGTALTTAGALRSALIAASFPFGRSGADPLLPDMRGTVPMGVGANAVIPTSNRTLGQRVGSETHRLTVDEMPAHTHTYSPPNASMGPFQAGVGTTPVVVGTAGGATGSAGRDAVHNNVQPSFGINFIIKL